MGTKTPLEWLKLPMQEFLFNWDCVEKSLTAEAEAMKEAQDEAKKEKSNTPQISFDDWEENVRLENAATAKEKMGIKRKNR